MGRRSNVTKSITIIMIVFIAGLFIGRTITGQAIKISSKERLCVDLDSDKYFGKSGCGTLPDCNDNNNAINPSRIDICNNNIDENCDGFDNFCGN